MTLSEISIFAGLIDPSVGADILTQPHRQLLYTAHDYQDQWHDAKTDKERQKAQALFACFACAEKMKGSDLAELPEDLVAGLKLDLLNFINA